MPNGDAALIFVVIAVVAVVVVTAWQGARYVARARRRGSTGAGLARMGHDLDERLGLVLRRVEAVRRDNASPGEIITLVSEATDAVTAADRTVKSLPVAQEREATRDAFELELVHAAQALEAILDACLELESSTQAERRERALKMLKWGHLNLFRARASLADHADVLDDPGNEEDSGWRASRI